MAMPITLNTKYADEIRCRSWPLAALAAAPFLAALLWSLSIVETATATVTQVDAVEVNKSESAASVVDSDRLPYEQAVEALRVAVAENSRAMFNFYNGGLDESDEGRQLVEKSIEDVREKQKQVRTLVAEHFVDQEQPPTDNDAGLVQLVAEDLADAGQYQPARKLISLLRIRFPEEENLLATETVLAAKLNDFQFAAKNLPLLKPATMKRLGKPDQALLKSVDDMRDHFEKELAIREQESLADDLPRVKLETTRGDIVIELFENEAPKTVANFIDLIQKGFYTQVYFHHVINELVAETGLVRPGGMVGVDYTIPDERKESASRRNFRGTVSMVTTGESNSGSTRFAILPIPAPRLDFDPKQPERPGQTGVGGGGGFRPGHRRDGSC